MAPFHFSPGGKLKAVNQSINFSTRILGLRGGILLEV